MVGVAVVVAVGVAVVVAVGVAVVVVVVVVVVVAVVVAVGVVVGVAVVVAVGVAVVVAVGVAVGMIPLALPRPILVTLRAAARDRQRRYAKRAARGYAPAPGRVNHDALAAAQLAEALNRAQLGASLRDDRDEIQARIEALTRARQSCVEYGARLYGEDVNSDDIAEIDRQLAALETQRDEADAEIQHWDPERPYKPQVL